MQPLKIKNRLFHSYRRSTISKIVAKREKKPKTVCEVCYYFTFLKREYMCKYAYRLGQSPKDTCMARGMDGLRCGDEKTI